MKPDSLRNLALFHLGHGDLEKYRSYAARMDEWFAATRNTPAAVFSAAALQSLFQLQRYDLVDEAFSLHPAVSALSFELGYLRGEARYRLGRVEDALNTWSALDTSPQEAAYLRVRMEQLHRYGDILFGRAPIVARQPRVHVLVLTKDREVHLRRTLECLRATDYRNYAVYIVDNASSDGTRRAIDEQAALFPPHVQVNVSSLPTNIGRPAGHNWLLTAWDHSSADYIAILDDDLIHFPPGWLRTFLSGFELKPDIGVVGGKTVGKDMLIQDAQSVITGINANGEIEFFTNKGTMDWGQFDYISNISDYSIGCACLYKREVFDVAGHFDIRFSPSQGVDIDHGLRMRAKGYDMLYCGTVTVVHAQLTTDKFRKDPTWQGNCRGNFLKLAYKHPPETIGRVIGARKARENAFFACNGIFAPQEG